MQLKRILIVDDSALSRRLVRRCLDFCGIGAAQLLEAGTGQEALALIEAEPVDLLLTDITMPVMDGIELLRAVAELPPGQVRHTVVVSSVATTAWAQELDELGVALVLPKPVEPAGFGKLRGVLGR